MRKSRVHNSATKARIRELLGDFSATRGDRMHYSHLRGFWAGQTDLVGPRLDQFTRSFVITLLSTVFFPVSSSWVHYGLLEALADVDVIPRLNWPRAILGQLYYGLDVCARCALRSFLGSRLVLLVSFLSALICGILVEHLDCLTFYRFCSFGPLTMACFPALL